LVVADDHELMRGKVVELLTPYFEVIGTASDGKTALELIRNLKPDIAVLDITMPFMTGIEVAQDLKKSGSEVKVVVITAHGDSHYEDAALSAGALAYVNKFRLGIDLIKAVESALAGKIFVSSND
jgi:two-component system, NarL family, nitrate/nitrite response regulator NarL